MSSRPHLSRNDRSWKPQGTSDKFANNNLSTCNEPLHSGYLFVWFPRRMCTTAEECGRNLQTSRTLVENAHQYQKVAENYSQGMPGCNTDSFVTTSKAGTQRPLYMNQLQGFTMVRDIDRGLQQISRVMIMTTGVWLRAYPPSLV